MADVFISYKREEIAWAARVAQALSEEGFSAFYDLDDDGIHAGEEWDKRLEQELAAAKCCVVLWSRASTESANVRSEARRANNRGILAPAKINACQAPLGLDNLQEAELSQWRGDRADAQWRFLVDRGVARKVGRAGHPPKPTAPAPPPRPQPLPEQDNTAAPGLPKWLIPAGAGGLALVALLMWSPWNQGGPAKEEAPPPVAEAPAAPATDLAAPAVPAPAAFSDARTTPATIRAPLVSNPASLPDFALFRECDGCPEMVVVPAGTFTMGSPSSEAGRDSDEGPQRSANIRRFAISRFETTWDEWTACVSAGACTQGGVDSAGGDAGWGRGRRPVMRVDWNDAGAFARWVNGQASAGGYRRPSEAEWEYAARAGTSTRWSFGEAESQLGAYAWFSDNSNSRTQPVGGKSANPWGLFDMHGNVWEWAEDCYVNSYSGLATNGAANTTGDCASRVIRGGSWNGSPASLRSASRLRSAPSSRDNDIGFRLARTL